MSSSNASTLLLPSECSGHARQLESSNGNRYQPLLHQSWSSSQGPVAILWDMENCPVPSDVRSEDVAGNIRMALRFHPVIDGAVTMLSAYGDFNAFPRRLREGCQRTGVKLIDVPNGRKDAADKAILIDMFLFALDNPPPSSIMLISGDVDFAPALHILGQRGYTIILAIPSRVGVSSALCNAGDIAGFLVGCHINNNVDVENEEESIVYRGVSRGYCSTRDLSLVSQSTSEHKSNPIAMPSDPMISQSLSFPSILYEVSSGNRVPCKQNDTTWVQPRDLNDLKGQLVRLLELADGNLPLTRLPAEYQKYYGKPLFVSEDGAVKLANLLKKMGDMIAIQGKGQKKFVCLHNSKSGAAGNPVILSRREKKEKESREDNVDATAGSGSSDEFSGDETAGGGGNDGRQEGESSFLEVVGQSQIVDKSLNKFKYELQEIMVSYSCRILLGSFESLYQQRYKKQLDYISFGVNNLEELLGKARDVVLLQEEPISKRKYMFAVCG
ncbi:uncharacterized protein LOC125214946 isoform X3 [Salvia hispanica]|uniref:uncharacterized protein LOC125214946 isoform X3 n=1 Tax=Salvia hispanica TaxID=49212 RepID=UPI002009084E|nr:uncharacterized protein LOC125214946 isoform X3 [Salvia hispanica]